jgi:hypothetical protein
MVMRIMRDKLDRSVQMQMEVEYALPVFCWGNIIVDMFFLYSNRLEGLCCISTLLEFSNHRQGGSHVAHAVL